MTNIREFLLCNGVLPNVKGFQYLQEAIECAKYSGKKITEIYEVIAHNHNETASKVTRAIKYAISKIQDFSGLGITIRPKNSEFISLFI
jgi:hypothetical protein